MNVPKTAAHRTEGQISIHRTDLSHTQRSLVCLVTTASDTVNMYVKCGLFLPRYTSPYPSLWHVLPIQDLQVGILEAPGGNNSNPRVRGSPKSCHKIASQQQGRFSTWTASHKGAYTTQIKLGLTRN